VQNSPMTGNPGLAVEGEVLGVDAEDHGPRGILRRRGRRCKLRGPGAGDGSEASMTMGTGTWSVRAAERWERIRPTEVRIAIAELDLKQLIMAAMLAGKGTEGKFSADGITQRLDNPSRQI